MGGGATDSWVHLPDQARPAAIPQPDEHPVPVASQDVIYPDDPGVAQEPDPSVADEVLQYDQRPKPPLVIANSNEETGQAMYVMLRRIGCPETPHQMRFGNPPASQRAIADVMDKMQQHIDWEYNRSFPIKDSWNVQCGALCCWVDAKFHEHQ